MSDRMVTIEHGIEEIQQKLKFDNWNPQQRCELMGQLKYLHSALQKYEHLRIFRIETEQNLVIV